MKELIIIGGGQAGLSAAYYAQQNNVDYTLLEKASSAGDSWQKRWKSLTLFSPKKLSTLPGMKMKGDDQDAFPSKDEMAKYMKHYADAFKLKITYNQEVQEVTKTEKGFRITTQNNTYEAKSIIMATGAFSRPFVPQIASKLSHRIHQLHTTGYQDVKSIEGEKVLVVGCGNSGAQIAYELANEGKKVEICMRSKVRFVPKKIGKIAAFEYGKNLGLYDIKKTSWKRYLLPKRDPIVGKECERYIKQGKIKKHPAIQKLEDDWFVFADGMEGHYDTVLWATGFMYDFKILEGIPEAFDTKKQPLHTNGISDRIEGLYFLGLPWMVSRKSALVYGVGDDAKMIVENIRR